MENRSGLDRRRDSVGWADMREWLDQHEKQDMAMLQSINGKLDRVVLAIEGDGTDTRPGLKLDVDRLKQDQRRQAGFLTWLSSLLAAAVAAGVSWVLGR